MEDNLGQARAPEAPTAVEEIDATQPEVLVAAAVDEAARVDGSSTEIPQEVITRKAAEQSPAMDASAAGEEFRDQHPPTLVALVSGKSVSAAAERAGANGGEAERIQEVMTRKNLEAASAMEASPAVEEFPDQQPPALVVLTGGKSVTAAAEAAGVEGSEPERIQEVMTADTPEAPLGMEPSSAVAEFSGKQLEALTALAAGESVTAAAKNTSMNPCTIHRWLKNPRFLDERDRLVEERYAQLRAKSVLLADKALQALEELLDGCPYERDRVQAVKIACRISGLDPSVKKAK